MQIRYVVRFESGTNEHDIQIKLKSIGLLFEGASDSSYGEWWDFEGNGINLRLWRNWDPLEGEPIYPTCNADDLLGEFIVDDDELKINLFEFLKEKFNVELIDRLKFNVGT